MDLAAHLTRALGSSARGRFFPTLPAHREVIRADRLLDPDLLHAMIVRAAGGAGTGVEDVDLRPAASRFTRQYAAAVLPPVLVGMAAGIGLDASIDNCSIVMSGHVPGGLHICTLDRDVLVWRERCSSAWTEGRQSPTLAGFRSQVIGRLFSGHLFPLFERVLELAKLSPDLVWSNVAEQADLVYEVAATRLSAADLRPFEDDWRMLLSGDQLPGVAGANPLLGWITRDPIDEPDFSRPLPLRRICCIHYVLPDRIGRLCSNCPLASKEERIAQARVLRGAHSLGRESHPDRGPAKSEGSAGPRVGEPAPDFTLPATGGGTVSLSDHRGRRPVVLYFYVADDGTACTAEAISFRDRSADFAARGVAILGVSPDSVESHEAFRRKYGLPFPLLADPHHEVAERYGAWRLTRLMSKEYAGMVHTTFVIDKEGLVSAVFTDVRGGNHADHVLAVFD